MQKVVKQSTSPPSVAGCKRFWLQVQLRRKKTSTMVGAALGMEGDYVHQ